MLKACRKLNGTSVHCTSGSSSVRRSPPSPLGRDEVVLSEQAAQDRLAALGSATARGAMRHIKALTTDFPQW